MRVLGGPRPDNQGILTNLRICKQFLLTAPRFLHFTTPRMSERAEALRKRIRESGRGVRGIAIEAEVPPYKLWRWVTGRTKILDMVDADKVEKVLTGEVAP